MSQPQNTRIGNFLYEYTDAASIIDVDAHALADKHNLPPGDVEGYADTLKQLEYTLVDVQASISFKHELREELLGKPSPSLMGRVRNLPPRLQFAAGLALLAAMALLGRRRLGQEALRLLQVLRSGEAAQDNSQAKFTVG